MATSTVAFALIMHKVDKGLLLGDRSDGTGWTIPGRKVPGGVDPKDGVVAIVKESTGLAVKVQETIGNDYPLGDGCVATAYACTPLSYCITPSAEYIRFVYCTKEEVAAGRICVGVESGESRFVSLQLFAPKNIRRMIYDAFSIMEEPRMGPNEAPKEFLPLEGIFVSPDGRFLIQEASDGQRKYPRLTALSPVSTT